MEEKELVEIDGSFGEGGGQILRTSLALSAILGKPFTIHHIRSKRRNPGLQAQHLKAVEASAQIAEGHVEGAEVGSQRITFFPQKIIPGNYRFEVKTAGSVTLILQAILLPLSMARGTSKATLIGGTHVPWSPPFHYFSEVLLPAIERMGISAEAILERWGYYPKGGGMMDLKVNPPGELKAISLVDRGSLKGIRGLSTVSHLPRHVAERQKEQALKRIHKELKKEAEIAVLEDAPSDSPGSFMAIMADYEGAIAGFSSLGSKGKPAEKVADEAVDAFKDYFKAKGCLDPHLGDQLIPFMALAKGRSSFTTTRLTDHLLTNLWVLQHFLELRVLRKGEKGGEGRVEFLNE